MDIASLLKPKTNLNIPAFTSGDSVKVSIRVVEGDKERTQVFQGVVIRIRHGAAGGSFTVRRVTYGVGVERTFPMNSPRVEKVEVVRHGKARRAKLYYLRGLSAKASRIKERRLSPEELAAEQEEARRIKQELEQQGAPKLEAEAEPATKAEEKPAPAEEKKTE